MSLLLWIWACYEPEQDVVLSPAHVESDAPPTVDTGP
jgi:hypothetical protein